MFQNDTNSDSSFAPFESFNALMLIGSHCFPGATSLMTTNSNQKLSHKNAFRSIYFCEWFVFVCARLPMFRVCVRFFWHCESICFRIRLTLCDFFEPERKKGNCIPSYRLVISLALSLTLALLILCPRFGLCAVNTQFCLFERVHPLGMRFFGQRYTKHLILSWTALGKMNNETI